jgi:hypothetical protein
MRAGNFLILEHQLLNCYNRLFLPRHMYMPQLFTWPRKHFPFMLVYQRVNSRSQGFLLIISRAWEGDMLICMEESCHGVIVCRRVPVCVLCAPCLSVSLSAWRSCARFSSSYPVNIRFFVLMKNELRWAIVPRCTLQKKTCQFHRNCWSSLKDETSFT